MATYNSLGSDELDADKIATSPTAYALYNNPIAIAEGAAGAPRIVYGALSLSNDLGQGELKSTSGEVSSTNTLGADLALPGGAYGLYPQLKHESGGSARWGSDSGYAALSSSTSYTTRILLATNSASQTAYAKQTYIQASPPHNLGYGEIGRFVFGLVDNTTGEVTAVYSASEAPWHYNGKTGIRPHKIVDGKKYRARKNMELPYTMREAMLDSAKILEYAEHFKNAETVYEEITEELKNRDMPDIPHPFVGNDLTGKTVVLLDPACDEMHEMNELCEYHDEFSINDLLHDGDIKIDNTPLEVLSPNGVQTIKFRMR